MIAPPGLCDSKAFFTRSMREKAFLGDVVFRTRTSSSSISATFRDGDVAIELAAAGCRRRSASTGQSPYLSAPASRNKVWKRRPSVTL